MTQENPYEAITEILPEIDNEERFYTNQLRRARAVRMTSAFGAIMLYGKSCEQFSTIQLNNIDLNNISGIIMAGAATLALALYSNQGKMINYLITEKEDYNKRKRERKSKTE